MKKQCMSETDILCIDELHVLHIDLTSPADYFGRLNENSLPSDLLRMDGAR